MGKVSYWWLRITSKIAFRIYEFRSFKKSKNKIVYPYYNYYTELYHCNMCGCELYLSDNKCPCCHKKINWENI